MIENVDPQKIRGIDEWPNGGFSVRDRNIVHAFLSNPDNAFIVSFGRTGTHWLLMLIQAYFQRPGLVGVFFPEFCPDWQDYHRYLYYHTHDHGMFIRGRNDVIYLYRNPVDVVYSTTIFKDVPPTEWTESRVRGLAYMYGAFSDKWFNIPCAKKTLVYYEALRQDPVAEWHKITDHFGVDLDTERFKGIFASLGKKDVKARARPSMSERVVPLSEEYEMARKEFKERWKCQVWEEFTKGRQFLLEYF